MNKTLEKYIVSEIRNTGFDDDVNALPVGDTSDPASLLYMSLTSINKLGVNPHSEWETPLGIYSYPLTEEYKNLVATNGLPFAASQPYIQIFSIKPGSKILSVQTYSNFSEDVVKLKQWFMANTSVNEKMSARVDNKIAKLEANIKEFVSSDELLNYIRELFEGTLEDNGSKFEAELERYTESTFQTWNPTLKEALQHLNETDLLLLVKTITKTIIRKAFQATNGIEIDTKPIVERFTGPIKDLINNINDGSGSEFYFDSIVKNAKLDAYFNKESAWIWNLTRVLAIKIKGPNRNAKLGDEGEDPEQKVLAYSYTATWSYILNKVLGYDGAVDFGQGLIHHNEPTQAVWFSKSPINHIKTIYNKFAGTDPTTSRPADFRQQKPLSGKNGVFYSGITSFYEYLSGDEQKPLTKQNLLDLINQATPEKLHDAILRNPIRSIPVMLLSSIDLPSARQAIQLFLLDQQSLVEALANFKSLRNKEDKTALSERLKYLVETENYTLGESLDAMLWLQEFYGIKFDETISQIKLMLLNKQEAAFNNLPKTSTDLAEAVKTLDRNSAKSLIKNRVRLQMLRTLMAVPATTNKKEEIQQLLDKALVNISYLLSKSGIPQEYLNFSLISMMSF